MQYRERLKKLLTSEEAQIFRKLNSSGKIQDYLNALPINFELAGETYLSPRLVLKEKRAHCFEGALFAAAVLAYHGEKPFLMDLQSHKKDDDHVVVLFVENGYWGAISKTNHPILRYRDPVYKGPRELAMSYFHEYAMRDGRKSLVAYSAPFDLSRFSPQTWVTTEEDLDWLVEKLDTSRHFPIVPRRNARKLRKADAIELVAQEYTEWTKGGKRTKYHYPRGNSSD